MASETSRPRLLRALVTLTLSTLLAVTAVAGSGNFLVITASAYDGTAPLAQFKDAKVAQGFTVYTYVVPSGTSRTAIKSYIQNLWGTPDAPDYILLVGDTDGANAGSNTIPHFVGGGTKQAPTDLPYACMDAGDDWYPDIFIGRFPVRDTSQLQAVVDKTLWVESGSFSDPFYLKRAAFLATDDSGAQAEQTHDWVITNYLDPAGYTPIRIYAAQGGGTQQVTNAVNQGCGFVNYFGHSSSSGWWAPSFNQANINALSNLGLYGVAFGFSCNTGNYSLDECFGETWVRAANKGAAAYISASTFIYYGGSNWESSRRLEKYFWQSFFVDGLWEIGPAWQAGTYRLIADTFFSAEIRRNMVEMFNILGDPSLNLAVVPGPIPTAFVQSPNGGELLAVGDTHEIRWIANDDIGVTGVDLFLSRDGGATYPHTIGTGLPNTGSLLWTVPPGSSAHCRIKVVAHDADGNTGEDTSNGDFAISTVGPEVAYDFPLDANPGWSISGGQWAFGHPTGQGGAQHGYPDPSNGATGTNVYGVNLAGDYSTTPGGPYYLTLGPLDLSDYVGTQLKFQRWLNSDYQPYVYATLQVSNNGTSWIDVWSNGTAELTANAWSLQTYDIGAVADDQPAVYVRWGYQVGSSAWAYSGWNIDDVQLVAVPVLDPGDLNCDGVVDFDDINPFVLALSDPQAYQAAYPDCRLLNGDCNEDGVVDFDDINAFVALFQ